MTITKEILANLIRRVRECPINTTEGTRYVDDCGRLHRTVTEAVAAMLENQGLDVR